MNYLFKSTRLGFRNWTNDDIPQMAAISGDKEVMRYFPATATLEQTERFIKRMQQQYEQRGHCYFAVDRLDTGEFIGFIGLAYQDYEADFTPCVDIGWRLKKTAWRKGFATEGAIACIQYGFERLELEEIYAVAVVPNIPSFGVMKKAGMQKAGSFEHPKLLDNEYLKDCIYYVIKR